MNKQLLAKQMTRVSCLEKVIQNYRSAITILIYISTHNKRQKYASFLTYKETLITPASIKTNKMQCAYLLCLNNFRQSYY